MDASGCAFWNGGSALARFGGQFAASAHDPVGSGPFALAVYTSSSGAQLFSHRSIHFLMLSCNKQEARVGGKNRFSPPRKNPQRHKRDGARPKTQVEFSWETGKSSRSYKLHKRYELGYHVYQLPLEVTSCKKTIGFT